MSDLGSGRADFDDFTQISFGEGEEATELFGEHACAGAVATGRIGPATSLTIYRRDGAIQRVTADRVPLFRKLLGLDGEGAGREAAPPIAAAGGSEAPSPPPPAPIVLASPPLPPPAPSPQPTPTPAAPMSSTAPQRSERAARSWIWPMMLALVLVAVLIARIGGRSSEPEPAPTVTPTPEASPSPADPDAGLEQQTLYTVRTVDLQSAPHPDVAVGQLPRGIALVGVIVPGDRDEERWFKIKQGPQTGLFVWGRNLSGSAPPPLDVSISGPVRIALDSAIYTEPREGAPITAGTPARVLAGGTADAAGRIGSDWFELLLTTGGVGYVPAFAVEPPEATSDADMMDTMAAGNEQTAASEPATHDLVVENGCSSALVFLPFYHTPAGWRNNDGQTLRIEAGRRLSPATFGAEVGVDADEIYYGLFQDGQPMGSEDSPRSIPFRGSTLSLFRAGVQTLPGGDYLVTLAC